MRIVLFCHSLRSDWNHGNAHFLRGVVSELAARGHRVAVYEPRDAWSARQLTAAHGLEALGAYAAAYPDLNIHVYDPAAFDPAAALEAADLAIVHEWNPPALVAAIGAVRARTRRFVLLFHDTHHRSVTAPDELRQYDLSHYDGVLAFGARIRQQYLDAGWAARAWTWHEAADVRVFFPRSAVPDTDVIWIGNWGDDERTAELDEFLLAPVHAAGARGRVYGVRYPQAAREALEARGIEYRGWLANHQAPHAFAHARVTVHVPRRAYVRDLPGIPTIRPFEALACGIPLISAPWQDADHLFDAGCDYLVARTGAEMTDLLRDVLAHPEAGQQLAAHGLRTVRSRHTCAHRVEELLQIVGSIATRHPGVGSEPAA